LAQVDSLSDQGASDRQARAKALMPEFQTPEIHTRQGMSGHLEKFASVMPSNAFVADALGAVVSRERFRFTRTEFGMLSIPPFQIP